MADEENVIDFETLNFAESYQDFWMRSHDFDPESKSYGADLSEIIEARGLWDVLLIEELTCPGIWNVAVSAGIDIQKLSPKGVSAARLEYAGYKPCEIELTGVIWNETQWAFFRDSIFPRIRPRNSIEIPRPISMWHPLLELYGINELVISSVSGPNSTGDDPKARQFRKIEIKALEFLPIRWKVTESGKAKDGKIISANGQRVGLEGMGHVVPAFGSDTPYIPMSPRDDLDYYGPLQSLPIVVPPE